jgi:hypothetical protein
MMSPSPPLPEIAAYLRRGKHVDKVEVPLISELPPALREAAETLPGISGTWNPVEIYTADPKTLRAEKQKFFTAYKRGIVYQPVFTYGYAEAFPLGDSRAVLEGLLERVRACATPDRAAKLVKLMLYYKIKDDLATCALVEGLQEKDDEKIGHALQYKYPGVDPLIYDLAEEDLRRSTSRLESGQDHKPGELTEDEQRYLHELVFDAAGVKEAFEWALDRYGILNRDGAGQGFRVEIDRRATAIDVRDKSSQGPTVFVPESTRETAERLLGLVAHEIEGHARQSWNGEKLFMFGGGPLKIDEETLYEGLAMRYETDFRERYFGQEHLHRNMDFYVFAVQRAESGGSFHDVYADQMDKRLRVRLGIPLHTDFSPEQVQDTDAYAWAMEAAWGSTYRVMRGHIDMRNPFGFAMAKDLAYFRGWILDHQLQESGHGHINEASICSIGQLRVLAEFNIRQDHLPAPFLDVTSDYLRILLDKRPDKPAAFAAKRR